MTDYQSWVLAFSFPHQRGPARLRSLPRVLRETPHESLTTTCPLSLERAGVLHPQNLQRREAFPAEAIRPHGSFAESVSAPPFPVLPARPPGGSRVDEAIETATSPAQPGKSGPLLPTREPPQTSLAQVLSLEKPPLPIPSYPNVPKYSAFPQQPWHRSSRFHPIYLKSFFEC